MLLLIFLLTCVKGSRLIIDFPVNTGINSSTHQYGVEVKGCTQMVYGVKVCHDGHMALDNMKDTDGYTISLGRYFGQKSSIRTCRSCKQHLINTPMILDCNEIRYFWVKWGNGRFAVGQGKSVDHEVMFDVIDPVPIEASRVTLWKWDAHMATTFVFGDDGNAKFRLVAEDGKFTADGMIEEKSTHEALCSLMCHQHADCGMFSYNKGLQKCALFNRMMSSFNMISDSGWKSWQMMYCD